MSEAHADIEALGDLRARVASFARAFLMPAPSRRVLIVEDEPAQAAIYARVLRAEGLDVTIAGTLAAAGDELEGSDFGCVVIDMHLPDGFGAPFAAALPHDIGVVAISGMVDPGALAAIGRRTRSAVLVKPFELDALIAAVMAALDG